MRFYMFEAALQGYAQHHPILGVGLNNSTAAMKEGRLELRDIGIPVPPTEPLIVSIWPSWLRSDLWGSSCSSCSSVRS